MTAEGDIASVWWQTVTVTGTTNGGAPHSDLRADLSKKREQVQAMFDHVAPRYDVMNDLMSAGIDRSWRPAVMKAIAPKPGEVILDLAAGTGTSSELLRAAGATVVATDLSFGMLAEGKKRHPDFWFINGDALQLPFADATFDAVTISFGLRNVEDTNAALTEMRRVTKPGGRIVVCEFSTPTWAPFRAVYSAVTGTVIPKLAKIASTNGAAYSYLVESIAAWPDQAALGTLLQEAGWNTVEWKNLTGGIVALHRGWN
ncbi:MAG: demethylmenaquinone methyltransferase [Propionibacteriaceae bacterium]